MNNGQYDQETLLCIIVLKLALALAYNCHKLEYSVLLVQNGYRIQLDHLMWLGLFSLMSVRRKNPTVHCKQGNVRKSLRKYVMYWLDYPKNVQSRHKGKPKSKPISNS